MVSLKFWLKNALLKHYPSGYKHYRKWQHLRDPDYAYARDRHEVRIKHNGIDGWRDEEKGGLRYRDYDSYQEYVTHQIQKLDEIIKSNGGFESQILLSYRLKFYRRFQVLPEYLPKSAHIVCAGARQGTEVEVLHDLGYGNAYGIDLNPGPNNDLVRVGDFMKLENPDSSVDMIYSNCLDHAFDLNSFFREHRRAIKPDGYVLYDFSTNEILPGPGVGALEAVSWESAETIILLMLKHFKEIIKLNTDGNWKWILLKGKAE